MDNYFFFTTKSGKVDRWLRRYHIELFAGNPKPAAAIPCTAQKSPQGTLPEPHWPGEKVWFEFKHVLC
jgi:hypothetical protein